MLRILLENGFPMRFSAPTFHNAELSITLSLSPIRPGGFRPKAMKFGNGHKSGIPYDLPTAGMVDDHGLHIIRQNRLGHTAEIRKGVLEAIKQGGLALVVHKFYIQAARKTHGINENIERTALIGID